MLRVRPSEFAAVPRTTARIRSPSRRASGSRLSRTTAQPSERTKPSADSSNGLHRPVGDRVTSILWHGEELDDTLSLSLCMNNYRASGAGGYGVYTECGVLREQPTEIAELIIDYVLRHKDITVDKTKWLNIIY